MIQASDKFKQAVRDGKPERALLRFDDTVFTQKDISITSGGLTFTERFNESTDLQIGSCPSSTLRVSLINRDGILENYKFGRFVASLGALVDIESYKVSGNVTASYNNGAKVFVGQDTTPYLLENGQACKVQPTFAVKGIVIDGDTIYALGEGRKVMAFSVSSYATKTVPTFDETAWVKLDAIASDGTGVTVADPYIHEWWRDGTKETYEYYKLGTFIAPRPAVVKKRIIDMEANDQMTLFEDKWARGISISYPTTLSKLLTAICGMVDVKLKSTTFPNSSLTVDTVPDAFEEATLSEVVYWIAEAAGCIARFDRDGLLELTWFNQTNAVFDEHDYSDFTPLSYHVETISQLHVRNQDSYEEAVVGSGDNAYMIQDNPFLRQNDEQKARGISLLAATNSETNTIYNRLASFKSFNPSSVDLFSDWTVQAGDIVTVKSGDESYSLPVYSATTNWLGSPKVTLESTGNETREPISELKRQQFSAGRSRYGTGRTVANHGERLSWAEINIDENAAQIQLTAGRVDKVEGRVSQAEIDIDGAEAKISLWANRTEQNEQLISQARIDIDGANARIDLQASRVEKAEGRISSAEIAIDGANAKITAEAKRIDEANGKISQAMIDIDGANAAIKLKASQTEVDKLTGRVSTAESELKVQAGEISTKVSKDGIISSINQTAEEIRIQASKINLSGYVTASQLEAQSARFDNLVSGLSIAEYLQAKKLYITGTIAATGTVSCPSVSCNSIHLGDYNVSWQSATVMTSPQTSTTIRYLGRAT